jgi:hypothetical protein
MASSDPVTLGHPAANPDDRGATLSALLDGSPDPDAFLPLANPLYLGEPGLTAVGLLYYPLAELEMAKELDIQTPALRPALGQDMVDTVTKMGISADTGVAAAAVIAGLGIMVPGITESLAALRTERPRRPIKAKDVAGAAAAFAREIAAKTEQTGGQIAAKLSNKAAAGLTAKVVAKIIGSGAGLTIALAATGAALDPVFEMINMIKPDAYQAQLIAAAEAIIPVTVRALIYPKIEYAAGLWYRVCDRGYTGSAGTCVHNCPAGFRDGCEKRSYERGIGIPEGAVSERRNADKANIFTFLVKMMIADPADAGVLTLALPGSDDNAPLFSAAAAVLRDFTIGSGGWQIGVHPRFLADVNGDGLKDIVGIGQSLVFVALANGNGFNAMQQWAYGFGVTQGWDHTRHIRTLADLDYVGKQVLIGFYDSGVHVALSTGSGFTDSRLWLENHFGANGDGGLEVATNPRFLADVNADNRTDIVGFMKDGVYVALFTQFETTTRSDTATCAGCVTTTITWTPDRFAAPQKWSDDFGTDQIDAAQDPASHPRFVADVNGDGKDDVIGFSQREVSVAVSTGSSFTAAQNWLTGSVPAEGWDPARHLLYVTDVNGDGRADIVGFGDDAVYVATSTGNSFEDPQIWIADQFSYNAGWQVDLQPRVLADTDGDGLPDIVGFGAAGVYVAHNTGSSFELATPAPALQKFGSDPDAGRWQSVYHQRLVDDINGDGRADIVGFGGTSVFVAISRHYPDR